MRKLPREYTRDQLYEYYISLNKSRKELALIFHTTEDVIGHDLAKYNIHKSKDLRLVTQGQKIQIDKDSLYEYYITQNHSTGETANYFGVHERTIRRRLREFEIQKSVEMRVSASKNSQMNRWGGLFVQSDFYKQKVSLNMVQHMKETCLKKYGYSSCFASPEIKDKIKKTNRAKYGSDFYTQTKEYHRKACHKYSYDGESFDSSWELCLWIYAKDHKEEIIRCPCCFSYSYNGEIYQYFPDFEYKGKIVEIKGNQLLDNKNNLVEIYSGKENDKLKKKQECMEKNNVQLWKYEDIKFAMDYVHDKYGSGYLKKYKKQK